ncbi:MAG: DUF1553 domain-containing protein [Pirellulales bacterium]
MPPARSISRRSKLAWLYGQSAGLPLIAWLAFGLGIDLVHAAEGQTQADQADQADVDPPPADPALAAFFEKKVRPLLSANCFECHGPDQQKGGLRLDSHESLLAGGDSGPAIEPGKPDESLLVDAVRYGQVYQMPPTGKLPPDEVAVLVEWVRLGVPWPNAEVRPAPAASEASGGPLFSDDGKSFWAFQAPIKPAGLPEVREPAWCKSPIDYFVLAGLEQHGLRPAPPADKRTLIRRATFDLVGLPPDQADVEAFLADHSPDAFHKVIDRLLASPHYGERWGRHWLDVARYADSNGLDENLAYVHAWRYRDYVVAAFNSDKPYDQFVIEQLAGDLLPSSGVAAVDHQRLVATGFLTLGAKMLAEDDPVKMEMDIIDEQLDTMGGALLGLTLGCARCHDHKFDPLPTSDYYSLAGIFKSTQTMDNFRVVAQWHERPLASADEIARVQAHREQLSAKKSQLDGRINQADQAIVADARRRVGDYLRAAARLERQGERPGPRLAGMGQEQPEGTLLFEAEKFDRGNVKIDFETYGAMIGVIYNQGQLPNVAEYDFELLADGAFQVELRYAAAEPRPVELLLDGVVVQPAAAGEATGSWQPAEQAWFAEAVCRLPAGKHTLRLQRDGPFPHFDRVALVPLEDGDAAALYTTPTELARELGLNHAILDQWSQYLLAVRQDPGSAWSIWAAAGGRRQGQPASAEEQSPEVELTPLAAALLVEPQPQSEEELVERHARMFESAEQAVQQAAAATHEKGDEESPLPDVALEALRQVLYDPAGPCRLPDKPERFYPAEAAKELEGLRGELAAIEQQAPPELPAAMAVEEGPPTDLQIHVRGSHLALGAAVPRRFPRILAGEDQPPLPSDRSGRLELARWITRPGHPLTSRVMVNRIWRGHFGEALVRTPDNFGRLGDRPANQPLLDWLAVRFIEEGWSVKAMHTLIMLSSTYQMSSAYNEQAAQADPDNRLHWRMNRRRLEAEAIRDSILAAGGMLDLAMGGSLLDAKPRQYVAGTASVNLAQYDSQRRSIYLPVIRSALYEVFQAFDFAEPSVLNGNRASTTVAPQALFMMNSGLVDDATHKMAAGLLARHDLDDAGRVEALYQRILSRPARPDEVQRGLEFAERVQAALAAETDEPQRRLRAWQSLCRVVVSTNEFIYIE